MHWRTSALSFVGNAKHFLLFLFSQTQEVSLIVPGCLDGAHRLLQPRDHRLRCPGVLICGQRFSQKQPRSLFPKTCLGTSPTAGSGCLLAPGLLSGPGEAGRGHRAGFVQVGSEPSHSSMLCCFCLKILRLFKQRDPQTM